MKNDKLFMFISYPVIILVSILVFSIISTPVVFYAFPQIHRLFLANKFALVVHHEVNYSNYGLRARSFPLSEGASTVTVWHIVSNATLAQWEEHFLEELTNSSRRIIVYFHSRERDFAMFSNFCHAVLELDTQIVAIDYKGTGESAGSVTKSGAVEDARIVYRWLRRMAPKTPIHFWAHSLGTGIAAAALNKIVSGGDEVQSIVLESPFFDTLSLMHTNFVVDIFSRILPRWLLTNSLEVLDLTFNTTRAIAAIDVPTLVLHSEHDVTLPVHDARNLVAEARKKRDFVFHVEWRCRKVSHFPSGEASKKELQAIVKGFELATQTFWSAL